ncbi:MAG: polysaccharide biosynthesis protein [Clostridia bacterium]|nr:polysaccharide biosynthesis protein [Clostridia bacterium]
MRGVMILTPATLLAKLIGLFYKIPLLHVVGVEGMAYFLSAYHVYSLLFVFSAAGLPGALSLLVSRRVALCGNGAVSRLFLVALGVFFLVASLGTAALFFFAEEIAAGLSMRDSALSLMAIAPALLLSVFVGAARGVFQGYHNMLPTALSEVIEAVGKLAFGITLASWVSERGASVPQIAAAAVLGITLGIFGAAVYLGVHLFFARKTLFGGDKGILPRRSAVLTEMLRVALPVTVSASVMSLVSLVDTVLISGRLQSAGFTPSVANALYSTYGNLAVPLYNLVPALLAPITLSLTPALSSAFASRDEEGVKTAFSGAFRLTALIAIPASLGLSVFASPILTLLYGETEPAVAVATPLLAWLAPALLPAVLIALTGAALQAANRAAVPVWSMLVGAAVKLIAEAVLLPIPPVGILGAPISTLLCNLTVLTINLLVLSRVLDLRALSPGAFFRPLLAAALAVLSGGALLFYLWRLLGQAAWQTPPTLLLVVALYAALALLFGAVLKEDVENLPGGAFLCRWLLKFKLLKEVQYSDKRRTASADFRKK